MRGLDVYFVFASMSTFSAVPVALKTSDGTSPFTEGKVEDIRTDTFLFSLS